MDGLGFLVWKISELTPIERTIERMVALGVRWVSIKSTDYTNPVNWVNQSGERIGNPSYFKYVIGLFRQAGIDVGTWGFIYPQNPTAQAQYAARTVDEFGFTHFLIDAEEVPQVGANWKDPSAGKAAQAYMDGLAVPEGFPVALCSYRFPVSAHPDFPTHVFINHRRNKFIASQMYWAKANNPGAQLRQSIAEYNRIRVLPHVPIGLASTEPSWQWEPTPAQIKEFIATAKDLTLPGWGFWVLDDAIEREDWLQAMTTGVLPPPPPPTPLPTVTAQQMRVLVSALNVRSTIIPSRKYGPVPGTYYKYSRVWFTVGSGQVIESLETIVDGRNIWHRVGQQQYIAERYDDVIYLSMYKP